MISDRKAINREVAEDLSKSYQQILGDIYEELLHPDRQQIDNIKHATKRMASFFAKRELENAKTQRSMNWFTVIVGVFTILNVVVYLLSVYCNLK